MSTSPAPATEAGTASVNTRALYEALRSAARFVSKRPVNATMACVLLDFTPGHLTLSTTDFDTRYTHNFSVDSTTTTRVAVPVADAAAALKLLVARTDRVHLTTTSDGALVVGHPTGHVTIQGAEAGDFPDPWKFAWQRPLTLTYDQWTNLLRVNVAVGTDDMLPVLRGIHFRNDAGAVTAEATDRFRFAFATEAGTSDDTWHALIDARLLKAVTDSLKTARRPDADTVSIAVSSLHTTSTDVRVVRITCADAAIELHALEGDFPKLGALFGPNPRTIGTTSRSELAAAAAFAAAAVDPKREALTISFHDDVATVTGRGRITEITETLPGQSGEDHASPVHVTATNLIQGLVALSGSEVTLTRHKPGGPVRLDDSDDSFTYVAMTRRQPSTD